MFSIRYTVCIGNMQFVTERNFPRVLYNGMPIYWYTIHDVCPSGYLVYLGMTVVLCDITVKLKRNLQNVRTVND